MGNSSNSYATINPRQGNAGDLIDAKQQQDNINKQQWAQEAQYMGQQASAKAKKEQELRDKIVAQNPHDTGSKSKNELQIKYIKLAQEKLPKVMDILNNQGKYTSQEVTNAQVQFGNLNKLVEHLKAFDEGATNAYLEYQKNVKEGKVWKNEAYEKNYQEGYGNKVPGLDEQGMPVLMFIDKDNDGIDDNTGKAFTIGGFDSYADIENGLQKYDFESRFDRDSELKGDIAKIKSNVNQRIINGGTLQRKTTGIEEKELTSFVTNKLLNSDGSPNALLKSFAKEQGVDLKDPKAVQTLVDGYANDIRLYSARGVEDTKINTTEDRRLARDMTKEETVDGMRVSDAPQFTKTELKTYNGGKISKNAKQVSVISDGYKDKAGSITALTEVYEDNGKIFISAREKNVNSATPKPELAGKIKLDPNYKPTYDDYNYPEKTINYNVDALSPQASRAILTTKNPETGEYFKSTQDFTRWAKTHINKTFGGANTATNTATKTTTPKFN